MAKKRIGELLVHEGYVTASQVEHALEVQTSTGARICSILIDLGYLSEDGFLEFLSRFPGMASIELARYDIDREIISLIPAELALQLEVVPIGRIRDLLTVAMVCPLDEAGLRELEDVTALKIKPVLCSRGAIYRSLDRYYRATEEIEFVPDPEADASLVKDSLKLHRIANLVQEIEELPALPDILHVIASVVNDPDSSADDLAKVISSDTGLSGKVLKLSNSVAFGFSREISDVKHAIALLGFKETQSLAMSVCVFDQLIDKLDFDYSAHWHHSFSCATLSRLIAMCLKSEWLGIAFMAGLFHDMGKVAIAMTMRGKQQEVTSFSASHEISSIRAEEEVLGITHAEAGYLLGEHWLLPAALTNAVRYHHDPENEPEPKGLAGIVFLADAFSKRTVSELSDLSHLDDHVLRVSNDIGLPEDILARLTNEYGTMAPDIRGL